jgi:hypothetical protein
MVLVVPSMALARRTPGDTVWLLNSVVGWHISKGQLPVRNGRCAPGSYFLSCMIAIDSNRRL